MDRQEAKLVLQAHRPDEYDTNDPAFAQALSLLENDRELKAWWEAQQAFDRKVAAKIDEIEPPLDLRASILAGLKPNRLAPQPFFPFWLAAAAAVAIVCAVSATFHASREANRLISTDSYQQTALSYLGNDSPALGMMSPDHDRVLAWLKARQAPLGNVPDKMASLPSVGCQKFKVNGHSVTLICFTMVDGRLVHLFIVHSKDLAEPPSRSSPQIAQVGIWSTASWSDGQMSYMLATQAGPDALKPLL